MQLKHHDQTKVSQTQHSAQTPLGKETEYDQVYSPDILFPIERMGNRQTINISDELPFHGKDVWTCYELSWLNSKGKPQVGIAYFSFCAESPFMVESKSFKLYLNSFNHVAFEGVQVLKKVMQHDLSEVTGAAVSIEICDVDSEITTRFKNAPQAICLDHLDIDDFQYQPLASLLSLDAAEGQTTELLCSHLLRTNCPVTGQPDWGSIYIQYSGRKINHANLLRYIVSFRQCQDFHEHCVERIFMDLLKHCQCESLSVYARYTRRGGLDINPYRATKNLSASPVSFRTSRQ